MSSDQPNKIVTTQQQTELATTNHVHIEQAFREQSSSASLFHFENEDGTNLTLSTQTQLLSSTFISQDITTVTKRTTTITTSNFFSTNRRFPSKYTASELRTSTIGDFIEYDNCKFDQTLYSRQVRILNSLQPYKDDQPEIITRAIELSQKLPGSETQLINSLRQAAQFRDPLRLIPLESLLNESYQRVIDPEDRDTEIHRYYLELLCFISIFPKAQFCPRDAAVRAHDVAISLEANSTLQSSLLIISNSLSTDFIDRRVQQYLVKYLSSTSNIYVQKIRWIIQNIEKTLVIDGPTETLTIERSVDIPVLSEGTKVAKVTDLLQEIDESQNNLVAVLENMKEVSPDDFEGAEEWAEYLDNFGTKLKSLHNNPSFDKIIENRSCLIEAKEKIAKLPDAVKNLDQDLHRAAVHLQRHVNVLYLYAYYIDKYDHITLNTVDSILADAQDTMAREISTEGHPDEVAKFSLMNADLTKLRTALSRPGLTQQQIDKSAQLLVTYLKVIEDQDTATFLQVAQWQLTYPHIYRMTIISTLKYTIDNHRYLIKQLSAIKTKIHDEQLRTNVEWWESNIPSQVDRLSQIADGPDPTNKDNADHLITMRNSFDVIHQHRTELTVENECRQTASNIDNAISLLRGERYVHVPTQVNAPQPRKPSRHRSQTSRIQFQSKSLFDDEEDNFRDLYPQKAFNHPVYSAWSTKTFSELIKPSKQVPLDIAMLTKTTVSKLNSRRSRKTSTRSSASNQLLFKQYAIPEVTKIDDSYFEGKSEEELLLAYQSTDSSVTLIENSIFRLDRKPLLDKFEFVEKTAPALQHPYFKDDEKLKSRYTKIYQRYTNFLTKLVAEPALLLPRPAVDRASKYLHCILITLQNYNKMDLIKQDEKALEIIYKWCEYLLDAVKIVDLVNDADDEAAIVTAKTFFLTFRSGLASFSLPAETLDEIVHRRTLSQLTVATLKTLLAIIQFNSSVTFEEYCTVRSAQSQLEELSQAFKDAPVATQQKKLFEETSEEVNKIISASDVNTSTADCAAQMLREVHLSLESDIKTMDDPESDLFSRTISVRLSIANLHVSDADEDSKLAELSTQVVSDFDDLINQVKDGQGINRDISDLSKAWVEHLNKCEADIKGIQTSCSIVSQSASRYITIADNTEDISSSLNTLENKRFPFPVTEYGKLTGHLDKLIDYVRTKKKGLHTRIRKQSDLSAVLQKHILSMQTTAKPQQVTDNYFDDFTNGFVEADVQDVQATIKDNVSSNRDEKSKLQNKVTKYLGKLFAAHIETFHRNYNINSKSTRVCKELLLEYCLSILECTSQANKALEQADELPHLKALIQSHIEAIQEIQNAFDDKTVYSDYGRQRIVVFAHFCCVASQMTLLHVFHLKQPDEPFDYEQLEQHSRSAQQLLDSLQRNFDTQTVFTTLSDVESISRLLESEDIDNYMQIIDLLNYETKFAQSLTELVEMMMLENDVRYWKTKSLHISLSSAEFQLPKEEAQRASASDLKRSIDIVIENLMQFRNTLQNGEVEESVLMNQIEALDDTTKVFCDSAINTEADNGFYKLIRTFRQRTVGLCNYLRTELQTGTYSLYSLEASRRLSDVNSTAISIIRQLGFMEMLEEEESANSVLSRLIKSLYLTRDEIKQEAEKQEIAKEVLLKYSEYCTSFYDVAANVLLSIKNSGHASLKTLQTKKIKLLRRIVFISQELINLGSEFVAAFGRVDEFLVESPEFLVKSQFEPIAQALREMKNALPGTIPQSGVLVQLVSSVIPKINIVIEPHFEDRPLLDQQQVAQ